MSVRFASLTMSGSSASACLTTIPCLARTPVTFEMTPAARGSASIIIAEQPMLETTWSRLAPTGVTPEKIEKRNGSAVIFAAVCLTTRLSVPASLASAE